MDVLVWDIVIVSENIFFKAVTFNSWQLIDFWLQILNYFKN